jgi:hypothetical protein
MSVQMASAKIKPESVSDVQAATTKMFAAINSMLRGPTGSATRRCCSPTA